MVVKMSELVAIFLCFPFTGAVGMVSQSDGLRESRRSSLFAGRDLEESKSEEGCHE